MPQMRNPETRPTTAPLFAGAGNEISGKGLVLLIGGLFMIY